MAEIAKKEQSFVRVLELCVGRCVGVFHDAEKRWFLRNIENRKEEQKEKNNSNKEKFPKRKKWGEF